MEPLLIWALIFLVVGLILAAFGFRGAASTAVTIAKWLAILFVIVFVVLLLMSIF